MNIGTDQQAVDIIQETGVMKSNRMNWDAYYQEIAEVVLPMMSNTFNQNLVTVQGQKKDQKRFDGTAETALYRFAAVMESQLTPRNSKWHSLTTTDDSLNRKPRVRNWFDDANDVLFKYRYAPQANFASQCHEHYTSLGAFGTACMFIDKLRPKGFRYATIHLSQVLFDTNFQGIVDRCYRPFKLSARNAVQQFGSMLPEEITKAAAGPNPMTLFDFIHCVKPNEAYDPARKDWRGMPFVSVYVAVSSQRVVGREGFHSFPFAISRYMTAPGETYGRSPAMQALSNIKVLNEQKKTVLKQGQRTVDPVLLAHDDGVLDSFSLKPGSINTGAINARGQKLVDVLPTGNLALGFEMMEQERKEINAAFLTDLFQILVEGSSRMTTVEVMERAREKGSILTPTMGRQESEFLGPLIERELDLAMMQNLLGPMPPELIEAGAEYKVIYDSPLARAQKAEETAGIMRTVQWAAEVAQMTQDPSALDHFDWDVIIPDLAANNAVAGRYMTSPDKLAAIRQNRAQQQAIQQTIQAGPTVAAISKNQGHPIN